MADTLTLHYSFVKPQISGSPDTWGGKLDVDLDLIDNALYGLRTDVNNNAATAKAYTDAAAASDKAYTDTATANTTIYINGIRDNLQGQINNVSGVANGALQRSGGTVTGGVIFNQRPTFSGDGTPFASQNDANSLAVGNINIYLPIGVILLWSGSVASIPPHWALCDGNNGTPNLLGRFVNGASAASVGTVGGATTASISVTIGGTALTIAQMPAHNHPISDPGHGHGITDPGHTHGYVGSQNQNQAVQAGAATSNNGTPARTTDSNTTGITINTGATNITVQNNGSGNPHGHTATVPDIAIIPPYYALAYIMRIS